MQIDHIDANTIRVKISKEELAERGIRVLDMINDRSKIQNFFYSILAEVDTDHTFTKDVPVSFQVMPNNGGLDLLITKVKKEDASTLQKMLGNSAANGANNTRRTGFADLDNANRPTTTSQIQTNGNFNSNPNAIKNLNKQYYCFPDLSMVIELADNLKARDLASSLYYYKNNYYLELAFLGQNYAELKPSDAWSIANEFGIRVNQYEMKSVKEIGKCLLKQDALGNIRHYFMNSKQD